MFDRTIGLLIQNCIYSQLDMSRILELGLNKPGLWHQQVSFLIICLHCKNTTSFKLVWRKTPLVFKWSEPQTTVKQLAFPHLLTWIQDSGPGNLTLGPKFCTESDFRV